MSETNFEAIASYKEGFHNGKECMADKVTALQAQLAARDNEIAALEDQLRQKITLAREVLTEQGAKAVEVRVLSGIGPRAEQLGRVLEAGQDWRELYAAYLAQPNEANQAQLIMAEKELADAVGAAYPPEPGA